MISRGVFNKVPAYLPKHAKVPKPMLRQDHVLPPVRVKVRPSSIRLYFRS
jgi:hypothetical protein